MRLSIYTAAPIAALGVLLVAMTTWSDRIQPLNLTEIVHASGTIFEGECIAVRTGRDPETGVLATWYDFLVLESILGDLDQTVTIKQFGGSDGEITVYSPAARYEPGERLILFLYGESDIGFSSAIGLTQGKFTVQDHPETGIRTVSNGMPAFTLFEGMEVALAPYGVHGKLAAGPERLAASRLEHRDFLEFVRELVEHEKKRRRVEER